MSFGSKAKTECEIGGYVKSTCPKYLIHNESCNCCRRLQKWVPLEEAQKLEAFIALNKKTIQALEEEHSEMRLKIQEANKILDEIGISDLIDERFLAGRIKRLREVLK
jgi:excinuclease UvrABC nuclease subunit